MSTLEAGIVVRPAARVLLFDAAGRLLLIRAEGLPVAPLWLTPGGGLKPGESYEAGALRELFEETGLSGAGLGPCVWRRSHVFEWQGRRIEQRERYFVVRVDELTPTMAHFEEGEDAFLKEHRWWTVEEIGRSDHYFVPRMLAHLLPPILAGKYPPEPFDAGR